MLVLCPFITNYNVRNIAIRTAKERDRNMGGTENGEK